DVLRGAVDEVLGVLEAEAGDLADHLDDADLVRAAVLEDDGELGLLFGRSRGSAAGASGRSSRRNRDRGRLDAPLVLERLRQRNELDDGEVRQLVDELFLIECHDTFPLLGLELTTTSVDEICEVLNRCRDLSD